MTRTKHGFFGRAGGRIGVVAVVATLGIATAAGPAFAASTVSQATAQAANINLLNSTAAVAVPSPATSATNNGAGSNTAVVGAPLVSALSGVTFLTAGALATVAEANTAGTSYACAGVVSPGGGIQVGSGGTSCSATGTNTGGVTVDLGKLPTIGSLLSSVADVKVTFDSLTAFAHDTASNTASGTATIAGAHVTVTLLRGLLSPITVPLTLAGTPNQNLLTAIVNSLTGAKNALLDPVITALSTTVAPVLSLVTNYQTTTSAGTFEVSALHIALLGTTGAVANLAEVTVGPNAPVSPVPAFPLGGLPIVGGLLVLVGGSAFFARRSWLPLARRSLGSQA